MALAPIATVVAPRRALHRETLRRLAVWALAYGRSCNLDVAALCLSELERHRSGAGQVLLDRPTVNQILWLDVWNLSQQLGVRLPEDWHTELWTVLEWLDSEDLLDPGSAPLPVLLEPLRCSGGLDETGQPLPTGEAAGIPCQCYIPHDRSLPPGVGQHIVGNDPDTFEPLLVPARLRSPSEPPSLADLEPLHVLTRRLRREQSGIEVHAEKYTFVGVVPADGRTPGFWLYRHDATSRKGHDPLILDATGRVWLPRSDRRFRLGYRWVAARDTGALFRAGGHPVFSPDPG